MPVVAHLHRSGGDRSPQRTRRHVLLLFLAGLLILPASLFGQTVEDPPVITQVRITGNSQFSDTVLRQRLQTQPNRSFLNIPSATLWLWMYRLGESGCCFHRRVANTFMDLGEPPAYFDAAVLEGDIERLRAFYEQEGFRDASVRANIQYVGAGDQINVRFHVSPGEPTYLRHVEFKGIDYLAEEQRLQLLEQSLLQPENINVSDSAAFASQDQRYSEQRLLEERSRLITYLRNEGYARVSRDSIRVIVYQQPPDSVDVTFRIRPGQRYRFGDIKFAVSGPETNAGTRRDTLLTPAEVRSRQIIEPAGSLATESGWVTSEVTDERRLDPEILTTALRFMPGDWYDQSRLLTTKQRLDRAGVFTFSDAIPLWEQTSRSGGAVDTLASAGSVPSATTALRLPHLIELRTRPRHRIRLESFIMQRTAVPGIDDRNELGAGVATSYSNANLFGHAEILDLRLSGSISTNLGQGGFLPSAQAELSTSLTYPYLIGPFDRLDRGLDLYDARTRLSLSFLTARRQEFTIRGRSSAQVRLELRHRANLASFVDLLDFNLSDPRLEEATLDSLRDRLQDDPFVLGQLLNDYNTPQINNALRYTLRSATVNPLRRNQGYLYEGIVELGGNLPFLLDRYIFTPAVLEGSLPGLPFFRRDGAGDRLVYHQYVRLLGDIRRYEQIGRNSLLAWRLLGGFAHPIGRSQVVPFDRRFYAGGATSIRGWGLRRLGPGAVGRGPNGSGAFLRSGDIQMEGSVELRTRIIHDLLGADWQLATFTDIGNVWLGPKNPGSDAGRFRLDSFYKQQAVGSGLGLRFVWDYLILRFDLAWKVHSPVPGRPLFPEGLRSPRRHFGIGHVF